MINEYQISLPFASISGKKVKADFTGGVLTSGAGVLFLREIERGMGVIKHLESALADRRHQSYIDHSYEELLSQRIYKIVCVYEDANDCNDLRTDTVIKSACCRFRPKPATDSGNNLPVDQRQLFFPFNASGGFSSKLLFAYFFSIGLAWSLYILDSRPWNNTKNCCHYLRITLLCG